jgi:hypothetical protein
VVWKNQDFKDLAEEDDTEGVGTHSYRKCPSNYARGCGAAPDEIEIRGRWKSQGGKKVVFRYIDVKQLTIDAKVAGILCVGSPCKQPSRLVRPKTPLASPRLAITNRTTSFSRNQK